VNAGLLQHLLAGGYLPVISPLSRSETGTQPGALNVNGDDAAARIAAALGAAELLLVADVAGVLIEGTIARELSPRIVGDLIANGTATGGMVAKLEAALAALASGVARVRIGDVHAIHDSTRGTVVSRDVILSRSVA
jgi:acetylglutamate kinase